MDTLKEIETAAISMMHASRDDKYKGFFGHIAHLCEIIRREYDKDKKGGASLPLLRSGWEGGEGDVGQACGGRT